MDKYVVTRQNAIIDSFHPDELLAICFNSRDAKRVCNLFNGDRKSKLKNAEKTQTLAYLKRKLAKYEEILKAHDLMPKRGGKKGKRDPNAPRKKSQYKPKMCPGYNCPPHEFTPTAGVQKMCPRCRREYLADQRRGKLGNMGTARFITHKVLTPEQILDIKDPDERQREFDKLSPAEVDAYNKIKFKREREEWKRMREKSFKLDDPVMGVPGMH